MRKIGWNNNFSSLKIFLYVQGFADRVKLEKVISHCSPALTRIMALTSNISDLNHLISAYQMLRQPRTKNVFLLI